jgi:hypothetical protein
MSANGETIIDSRNVSARAPDVDGCMELWLVRHGETHENKNRVIAGHSASGLTDIG